MTPETEIKIRGYHLDVYGHVNNARYLEFLEEARWSFFDGKLENWASKGLSFFVVNINISYRSPAFLNTTVSIQSTLSKFGNKSCVLKQTIRDKATHTLIADADVTFVIADTAGKALPITGDILNNLKQLDQQPGTLQ